MNWVEEIVNAFKHLGGKANYKELYEHIENTASEKLSKNWKATVRARIEERSSDSQA